MVSPSGRLGARCLGLQNWCVSSFSCLGFRIHSFCAASSAGLPSPFLFFSHPFFGAIFMDERIVQLPRRTANFLKDQPAAAPISEQAVAAVSQQTCCSRKSSELIDPQRYFQISCHLATSAFSHHWGQPTGPDCRGATTCRDAFPGPRSYESPRFVRFVIFPWSYSANRGSASTPMYPPPKVAGEPFALGSRSLLR